MLVEAEPATKIGESIGRCRMSRLQFDALPGIPQPMFSSLLCGQLRGIAEIEMSEYLTHLGCTIETAVGRVHFATLGLRLLDMDESAIEALSHEAAAIAL